MIAAHVYILLCGYKNSFQWHTPARCLSSLKGTNSYYTVFLISVIGATPAIMIALYSHYKRMICAISLYTWKVLSVTRLICRAPIEIHGASKVWPQVSFDA